MARLSGDAKQNVVCYYLFENGITYNDLDYGKEFWEYGALNAFPGSGYLEVVPRRMQVYIDDDIIIFGMLGFDFHYEKIGAAKIDPEQMTVALSANPAYGVTSGSRYGFENVFEELDAPASITLIKTQGILYLYPQKDMNNAQVKISVLDIKATAQPKRVDA